MEEELEPEDGWYIVNAGRETPYQQDRLDQGQVIHPTSLPLLIPTLYSTRVMMKPMETRVMMEPMEMKSHANPNI
jgi:hypothetical protein